MVAGSLALHLLALLALWLARPSPEEEQPPPSDQVAMVFESQTGAKEASTESATPSPAPSVAAGNPDAPVAPPSPDTALASLSPPPSPVPPVPPRLVRPPPPTPAPASAVPPPPVPQPPSPASVEAPPPPPQPIPTPNRTPPTVSLNEEEAPALQPLPPFVPPTPPLPLPPLPPRPRIASRPAPRTSSPLATPQNWSFNAAPQTRSRASRGLDLTASTQGGQKNSELGYVSGAKPTGDWMGALRRWTSARIYYPEEALAEHQQGTATVLIDIARSGKVLSVRLLSSARSPFLDGAWVDIFRNSVVPPFTPDMTGDDTTITYTLHYILVSR